MPKSREVTKEQVLRELRESVGAKLVDRREAPLIGLIFFNIALWGSKLFTHFWPGTSTGFTFMGEEIHFHHFHYGIIAIVVAIVVMFIEGAWPRRIGHMLFGAGLGFIVDEYWMLLLFDDSEVVYFSYESQLIALMVGIVVSIIYGGIVLVSYFFTKREREIWMKFYDAVESGKIKIDI